MKAHHLLSVFALLFSALLWGCGGGHDARVMAELDRADSLLRTSDTAAHSAALRQMLALDTARALQADEMLRARHALLLVQARYKCYVTEPADSALIDQALRYYADHHGSSADHERYTRALIYSGAVAEELGHPQQAMQYYLEAESTADPNDHHNMGHSKFLIANIYQRNYTSVPIVINKYKEALSHYLLTDETKFQVVCYREIGALYRAFNTDSALIYLDKSISLASKLEDTNYVFSSQMMLARLLYEQGSYQNSKNLAVNIINNAKSDFRETQQFYIAADSYIKLGMLDSAQFIINNTPTPERAEDSMRMSRTLSELHKSRNNYKAYSKELIVGNQIADSILIHASEVNLISVKEAFQKNNLSSELKSKNLQKWILIISVLCLLAIFGYFIFKHYQDKKKWQSLVTELYENRNELEDNHTDLLAATKKHEALRALLMQHFKLMDELIKLGDSNPNNKLSQQLKDQISATYSDKNFVTEMRNFVSMHADETLTDFLASCDKNLNEIENNIVTLTACGFSSPEIALLTNQKDASYIRVVRRRIAQKLHLDTTLKVFLSSHFSL